MRTRYVYLFVFAVMSFPVLSKNPVQGQSSEGGSNLSLQIDSATPMETYVEVTGPGIKKPLQYKLRAGRGKSGAVFYVPPGNDRTFSIVIRNDKGDATYLGVTRIAVKENTPSTPVDFTPYGRPEKLTGILGSYRIDIEQEPSPAKIGQAITYKVQVLDSQNKVVNLHKKDITLSASTAPSFPKQKGEDDEDPPFVTVTTTFHGSIETCWQSGACSFPWTIILTPAPFKQIVSGDNFSCALDSAGSVWCWGEDDQLELGYPANYVTKWPNITGTLCMMLPCSTTPVPVSGNITFQSIAAGTTFVCGIDTSGKGWCWGDDSSLQFGVTAGPVPPQAIGGAFADSHKFLSISAGNMHACGVMTDQSLFCWGRNVEGQLGIGSTNPVAEPTKVNVPGKLWKAVSAGTWHTCGLTTDSLIYCWGDDASDELGIDFTQTHTDNCGTIQNPLFCMRSPTTPVPAGLNGGSGMWNLVSAGHNFSCGRDVGNANVYCWGESDMGQLGAGNLSNSGFDMSAAPLQLQASTVLASVVLPKRDWYGCAIPFLTGSFNTVCWGAPFFNGVPWTPTTNNLLWSPAPIPNIMIRDIAPASDHICVLDTNNAAWCWGTNDWGQLGNGSTTSSTTPVRVVP